ncbi:MAG: hypothetical protein ABSF47_02865 [Minisyncoccia bacterium]
MPQAEFNMLREPKDAHSAELWKKHGLGEKTSFELMRPIAKKLLMDTRDSVAFSEGVQMVLGRRVDAGENDTWQRVILTPPVFRFDMLLLQFQIEKMSVKP